AFQKEKDAVNDLRKVSGALNFINRIVKADRLLAVVIINEAAGRDVVKARDELSKGDDDVAAAKYESGIEHYRNAWNQATSK
ncbi:MAG: hypothetical protein DMF59_19845, partial [Acidobacteria bacterium]